MDGNTENLRPFQKSQSTLLVKSAVRRPSKKGVIPMLHALRLRFPPPNFTAGPSRLTTISKTNLRITIFNTGDVVVGNIGSETIYEAYAKVLSTKGTDSGTSNAHIQLEFTTLPKDTKEFIEKDFGGGGRQ